MISLVLASRLLFGSLPHGLQENPDADLTNQLFNNAETSYCNLIDNSTSIFHKQLFDQSAFFLPSEDVGDFFNKSFQNTSNNFNFPTEYQPPVIETFENYDFGFQSDTNNNNDNSTLQNNIQFDPSFDFDLNLLAPSVTSQLQDDGSTFPSYTEFEGSKTESSSEIVQIGGIVPSAPVQATFDPSFDFDLNLLASQETSQHQHDGSTFPSYTELEESKSDSSSSISEIVQIGGIVPTAPVQATFNPLNNSLSFATKFPTVKSNSSRCKKYREEKKNKKIAAEEELKELELKNYTLKAKLKEKEEKVRKIREMTKSFFDPRSSKKLSIDAILLEFV